MLKEFKDFAMRGNVIDLAVGIIIGAAFGRIVQSLVNDIIMPPIGLILGNIDFSNLFLNLSSQSYDSLSDAQEAGAATINYGLFINHIITFVIVAFCVFVLVKNVNRLTAEKKKEEESAAPPEPPRDEVLLEEIRDLLKAK